MKAGVFLFGSQRSAKKNLKKKYLSPFGRKNAPQLDLRRLELPGLGLAWIVSSLVTRIFDLRGGTEGQAEHSQGHQIKPQKGQKMKSNMVYLNLILNK